MYFRVSLRFASILVLLISGLTPALVTAQPLADKLPDDAVLYAGWRGSDDLGPGYAGSRFKAFLDSSQVRELLNQFLPALLDQLGQNDREAAQIVPLVKAILPTLVKHPTAIYVGPVDDLTGKTPKPHIALLCDAGEDSAALNNVLTRLFAQLPPQMPVPVRFQSQGTLLIVTVGDVKIGGGGNTLAGRKEFTDAMAQVSDDGGKSSAAAFYIDFEYILAQVEQASAMNDRSHGIWQSIRAASGIGSLKRVAATSGFDGKDWGARLFVSAPAPRTGVLALLDYPALGDDLLKAIPVTATSLAVGRLDVAKLVAIARESATKVGVNADMENGIQQVNKMLGFDLEKDLLQPAGDQWGIYSSPMIAGEGLLGVVALGKPRDAAKFEQSVGALEQLITRMVAQQTRSRDPKFTIMQVRDGDLTIHYMGTPLLTPAWAIRDGIWIAGLSPQAVSAAAASIAAKEKSVLENESFQAVRLRLGGDKASAISFIDLPKTAPQSYGVVVALSRVTGFGDLFGVPSPAMVLPTLPKLLPSLAPAGGVFWSDDAGFHARAVTPFPGAEIFGGSAGAIGPGVAALPLAVGMLVPATFRARTAAKQTQSASNLRQIATATIMYTNDNRGYLPPDLGYLLPYIGDQARVFISPDAAVTVPQLTGEKLAAWVKSNSSYLYIGTPGKKISQVQRPSETLLAYEKVELSQSGRVSAAYMDGHVEILSISELQRQLAAQPK